MKDFGSVLVLSTTVKRPNSGHALNSRQNV